MGDCFLGGCGWCGRCRENERAILIAERDELREALLDALEAFAGLGIKGGGIDSWRALLSRHPVLPGKGTPG